MGDSSGNTASSLAVAEKRTTTHRSGGCVGIFFQLFDWNRRFAKKKLFSMKLLPPARAKQTSKKFKGNEKPSTSKLHLIAEENKGGFPNMKKNAESGVASEQNGYETRTPGLVARLMGLESMPVTREKPRNGSFSEDCDNGEKKVVNSVNGSGNVKLDCRPQKLQKTGQFERKAVTRLGPDSGFQIKNVLSRSRKHYHHNHHPKFVSPVKSPRIPSGKNVSRTSRLIGAATKILEPGLQSKSKKCALTYTSSAHYLHPDNEPSTTERMAVRSEEPMVHFPGYNADMASSLTAQTSCKSCGNLLDVNCRPNVDEDSVVFPSFCSGSVDRCSAEGTGRNKPMMPGPPCACETEPNFQGSWDRAMSPVPREKKEMYDVRPTDKPVTERKFPRSEGLAPWPSSSFPCGFQTDMPSSVNSRQRVQMHDQMALGRDRTPPRTNSKPNIVESGRVQPTGNPVRGTKDFVSMNRNLSAHARPRVHTSVDSSNKLSPERRAFNGREEALPHLRSPVRKRRITNIGSQVESRGVVSSTALKPRNSQCDSATVRDFEQNANSTNRSCVKNRLAGTREVDGATKFNSNGVISFAFNYPIRQKPGGSMATEKKTMDDEIKMSCRKPSSVKGDFIAALLEQNSKELTSQEDDEIVMGRSPRRSTAMILQELISALTAERPDIASASTAEIKHERSAGIFNVADHLSPGSVLEASFSSSSLDDCSGHRLYTDSIDYSSDQLHYLGPDYDILDLASSSRKETTGFESSAALVTTVSRVLDTINLAGERLTEIGLSHAKQVVTNAELLFGNAQLHRLDGLERLFLGPILLELEAIANIAWTNINLLTGCDATKSGNQYRGFLFDCLIECLESKYGQYPNSGFRAWMKLPSCMDRETIIGDVENEMKKWRRLVGMLTDEIIDWEMSHSLGKWTDYDIEAFDIGNAACDDILEGLVDETLIDIWE